MLVAVTLAIAIQPAEVTRATPPSTWAPLPQSAFGPVSPPAGIGDPLGKRSGETGRPVRDDVIARPSISVDLSVPPRESMQASSALTPTAKASPAPVAAPKGPTHIVATGDNLWTIARRHSADLASIVRWNDGVDPDRLVTGQRILVPGGSKMPPTTKPAAVKPRTTSSGSATVPRPASIANPAVPRVSKGAHLWPLAVRGELTRRYSAAHPGIDIAAPQGTPVRAIAAGTVVWAGWKNNGGGYVVEVAHPNGMRSIYNHNSKLTVRRGDRVARGETIARVGSTGNSTGPHLDIRIWMAGRLVNPLRYL